MVMQSHGPSPQELDRAMEFLRFKSILRRADTMSPNRVDGIINHTIRMLMWMAVKEEGESDWVARHLHAGDMPPTTTTAREWIETTATTSETFVTAAIGNGTSIADDTFIGIYGCRWLYSQQRNGPDEARIPWQPPATFLRFTVGGTRVAEWDLHEGWLTVAHQGPSSTATEKLGGTLDFPLCVGESPILVAQNKTILLEYYEQVPTTATDFSLELKGIVVEKRGAGDGLNP